MIMKVNIRIPKVTVAAEELNRLNDNAMQKLSSKYDDRCRITAFKRVKNEIELLMFIDYQYITVLDSKKFTLEYMNENGIQGEILNNVEITHREFWHPFRYIGSQFLQEKGTDEAFKFSWDNENWTDLVTNTRVQHFEERIILKKGWGLRIV